MLLKKKNKPAIKKAVKSIASLMQGRMNVGMVARLLHLHQIQWTTRKEKSI